MLECLDSPGPFTTQPITATFIFSTPGRLRFPLRHLLAQVGLDLVGHVLEEGAGGAAAAGAGGDLRREAADARAIAESAGETMTSSVRSPLGSGVSEARMVSPMPSCSSGAKRSRGGHDSLAAEAGFGETQVQRVIAGRGQRRYTSIRSCTPLTLALRMMRSCAQAVALGGAADSTALATMASMRHLARVLGLRQRASSHPSCGSAARHRASPSSRRCVPAYRSRWPLRSWCGNYRPSCVPISTLPGLMRYFARARAHSGYFLSRICPL